MPAADVDPAYGLVPLWADLLRRRPDVRRTERQLAAQRGTNRTITVTEEDLTFANSPDWELVANVMGKE